VRIAQTHISFDQRMQFAEHADSLIVNLYLRGLPGCKILTESVEA